jgi:hypothetical protein
MSDAPSTLDLDDHEGREKAAFAVAAGGVVALGLGLIVGSGLLRALGLVGVAAGGGLLVREKLADRAEKIDAAADQIRSELDDLDPVARAQVVADLAKDKL